MVEKSDDGRVAQDPIRAQRIPAIKPLPLPGRSHAMMTKEGTLAMPASCDSALVAAVARLSSGWIRWESLPSLGPKSSRHLGSRTGSLRPIACQYQIHA